MRQILATGKKSNHWPPELRNVITYRSPQHRISCFDRVEHRTLAHRSFSFEFHFAIHACERTQMRRKHDAYHGSVWTSTERTAGKSRTIGFQLLPASADA